LEARYRKAIKAPRGEFSVSQIGTTGLPIMRTQVTRDSLSDLAQLPGVVAILPNQQVHLIEPTALNHAGPDPAEVQSGLTWGLKRLRIPELWETTRGQGIHVAVLDTGVYAEHKALGDRVKAFVAIDSSGRCVSADASFDAGNHGTHVCGTIAGGKAADKVAIGVAPEAELVVGAVLLGGANVVSVINAISWAVVEQAADVVNMSFGFTYYEPVFSEVLKLYINQYDFVPAVAIGNERHGNSRSPGNAYESFSVGAVGKAGQKVAVAPFSSGVSLAFPEKQGSERFVTKPDVVAPGAGVLSCVPPQSPSGSDERYMRMDGTSMATPHVAGIAALLMSARPEASAADIMGVLKETARHPSGSEARPDNRWGYGLVDPVAALKALNP